MKTQTLKGFRDFLPQEAKLREWLRNKMIKVFESWGYQPLETPTLEYLELFEGEIGEEEKLFYKFTDLGGRKVALRYDQTVPTCRVIGNYFDQLTFPFRRYQIQPAFRAEKPQKGRYREFLQSDLDIFGIASPLADAEVISVSLDLYRQLGFKKVIAVINNRDLMTDLPYPAIASIDKLDKIGEEKVIQDMVKKNIAESKAKQYLETVKNLKPDKNINQIFNYLNQTGFPSDWYEFKPTLARAFSYSQGPIWEIIIPEYDAGSVGGGERYDDLVEKISGQKIPGTGIGIGFDRTLEAVQKLGLTPQIKAVPQVLVTVFEPDTQKQSLGTAAFLRKQDVDTEVYPDPEQNLTDQLDYANKKAIPFVVIIGPDEIGKDKVTIKNMASGKQQTVSLGEGIKILKKNNK